MNPLRSTLQVLPSRSARGAAAACMLTFGLAQPLRAQGTTWNEQWAGSESEVYVRALAARGLGPTSAWSIRPLAPTTVERTARALTVAHPWSIRLTAGGDSSAVTLLRPSATAAFNSAFAWGMNDGPAWQGRGLSAWATAGATARWRFLRVRLEPAVLYAANRPFELHPAAGADSLGAAVTGIDLPQRFGSGTRAAVAPGQSYLRADVGPVGAGVSTSNVAWGPGIRHGLLLGPNASGFPHLFAGTNRPIATPVGAFAAQVLYASLEQSDWAPASASTRRFGAGFVGTWMPLGDVIELGVSRFYHRPWPSRFSLSDLGAPFGSAFRDDEVAGTGGADNQLASVFATIRATAIGVEVFGEFARNDRSQDLRDLTVEPEHNAAWLLGMLHSTARPGNDAFWTTRLEVVNARISRIAQLGRGQAMFYTHGSVRQGHTHDGQLLGTPLAEQSGGLELAVDRWAGWGRAGVTLLERQLPGDRGVGMAADSARTQWDLGASATLFRGGTDVHVQLGHVWDLNRFPGRDVGNAYLRIGVRGAVPALPF